MENRTRVADFWDEVVDEFLAGGFPLRPPLDRWIKSYVGVGEGAVDHEAFPEPYTGPILGEARGVMLGLNPGTVFPEWQYRDGILAEEARRLGGYRHLVRTTPVCREPWLTQLGPVGYHINRVRLMQRWNDDSSLGDEHLLTFELYPWHSRKVMGTMRPPPDIIDSMIFQPISETGVRHVFAFGAEWFRVLDGLGLEQLALLGRGGQPYGSNVASRTVGIYQGHGDFVIVAEKHSGSAGPPSAAETIILRDALERRGMG